MDGWLIYAGLIVLAAALLALGRGWWFGLPGSVLVALAVLLFFFSDYAALGGLWVAVISGAKLPPRDRLAAIPTGVGLAAAFLFVIPSGPDSPLNFIVAGCAGAFAIGALIGWVIAALKKTRGRKQVEA